jgi:IS30 family transposase
MTDEAENDAPAKPKTKAKSSGRSTGWRLLAHEWLEIVQMARSGVPAATIAKHFNVTTSTIYVGLRKRRVAIGAYSTPSAEFEESQERKELLKRVRETKENDYKYTEFIQRRSVKLLMDAEKDGRPP